MTAYAMGCKNPDHEMCACSTGPIPCNISGKDGYMILCDLNENCPHQIPVQLIANKCVFHTAKDDDDEQDS